MSKGYLVFHNAELRGVLEDKDEYKRFKKQRPSVSYDYVKLSWDEILRVVEKANLGSLQTVNLSGAEDIVVFANEYEDLIEYCYMELKATQEDLESLIYNVKEYIKFTDEELLLINGMFIVISKLLHNSYDNGIWFENQNHGLNLRPYVETWLESIQWEDE